MKLVKSTPSTPPVAPKFLTFESAGHYLGGLTKEAVRHMARSGKFPCSKIGGRMFVAAADIDKMMEKNRLRAV